MQDRLQALTRQLAEIHAAIEAEAWERVETDLPSLDLAIREVLGDTQRPLGSDDAATLASLQADHAALLEQLRQHRAALRDSLRQLHVGRDAVAAYGRHQ